MAENKELANKIRQQVIYLNTLLHMAAAEDMIVTVEQRENEPERYTYLLVTVSQRI